MRFATKFLTVAVVILCFSSVAQARNIKGVFTLGLDLGGDELANVTFVGGDTDNIRAGGLLSFAGGVMYSAKNLDTMFTTGYKFDNTTADNGDIDWYRYPVDLLVQYKIKRVRIGGGLSYHLNPTLKGDGFASSLNVDFDNALGFIVQSDFIVFDGMTVGLRYTNIEYEVENRNLSADGNSVGLIFGAAF